MIQLPIGINAEAWSEWEEFRRVDKRKKITPRAANKQFEMLLKYSEAQQQQIIDHSISNDYQGLFALKPDYNQPTGMLGTDISDLMQPVKTEAQEALEFMQRGRANITQM